MMLATKNERSILENVQVYWKYCFKYASLLEILLKRAVYPVNLHTLSSISSKLAHFLKYFVHFSGQYRTSYINFPLASYLR